MMLYAVHCKEHGLVELSEEEYRRQMVRPDEVWVCPTCRGSAIWDDEVYEKGLEHQEREQHRPKHHRASDFDQIIVAKALFEWWWECGTPQLPAQPDWEQCTDRIQAFWMDGAWRVWNTEVETSTTLTGRLHR